MSDHQAADDRTVGVTGGGQPRRRWQVAVSLAAVMAGAVVGMHPLLGFAGVSLVLLGIVIMAKPDWATLVAVALLYSNAAVVAHRIHGLPKPVAQGAGLLVAVALVHHLGVRRRPFIIPAATPWVAVFLAVQLIGVLRASEPYVAIESAQDFITDGLFVYLAFSNAIRTRTVLRSSLWIILAVGALLSVIGLHQSVTGQFANNYAGFAQIGEDALERHVLALDVDGPDPRLAGPIGDMNFFAQMLFVLVPMGLMMAFGLRRWSRRLVAFGLVGLITVGCALTVSRGGAVGLVLALLVLTSMRYIQWRYLVVVVLGIAVLLATSPRYAERLTSIGSVAEVFSGDGATGDLDQATMGRLGANVAAFRVFAEHPILGVGPGMFNSHYRQQAIEAGFGVHEDTRSAHNFFLQVAAEFGIIGFTALLGVVGITLRDLRRARKQVLSQHPELAAMIAGIFGAIVTYLTTGLFLSLAYERYFWFLLALGAASISVASRTKAFSSDPPVADGSFRNDQGRQWP